MAVRSAEPFVAMCLLQEAEVNLSVGEELSQVHGVFLVVVRLEVVGSLSRGLHPGHVEIVDLVVGLGRGP